MPDWALTINDALFRFVTRDTAPAHFAAFVPLGIVLGVVTAVWANRLVARESNGRRRLSLGWTTFIILTTAALDVGLVLAVIHGRCQWLVEGGSIDWAHWRLLYHFLLVTLLVVATTIDFDQYLIPDEITVPGMLIGVGGATLFGNLQLIPLWIDWNLVNPFQGPYIPQWIKDHPHWHGLAWSLAGLATGAGVTWLARRISQRMLGVEALGFGDVTLMAMIGSFLGWQPVLFVFLLAPLCGLTIGVGAKVVTGRRAIPYGPFLCAAALLVLFTWRWIWTPTREVFGHWQTLVGLAALVIGGLAGLLGLLRLYRSIPVTRRRDETDRMKHS
ncbi:MAG: prepilin peptidase [Planctomycetaceae bacterium]